MRRKDTAMIELLLAYPKANALRSQLTWTHDRTLIRLPDEQRAFCYRVLSPCRVVVK